MMDLIVSWLCSGIALAFQGATEFFSGIFGYDITEFNRTFSFALNAYETIRSVALALALLLAAWQIITFFTRGAEASATPVRAALNTVVAIGFIYYGNYLFELVLDFCQYPYDALNEIWAVQVNVEHSWGEVICMSLSEAFAGTSMLLYLIMLILICFSFIKLLLEIVERYVVTFVLIYLSPLASATLASSSTSGIYKKFLVMFLSQCLLLFLNVWCLRMACSGLSVKGYEGASPLVPLLLCYAFLRVSAKMDSYINQLGLNAAITGNGLGAEIFATGASLLRSRNGGGAGGEGGNKVLGAAKLASKYAGKFTPFGTIRQGTIDAAKGAWNTASENYRSARAAGSGILKSAGSALSSAPGGASEGLKMSDNLVSNTLNSSDKINTITQSRHVQGAIDKINAVKFTDALANGKAYQPISLPPSANKSRDILNEQLVNGAPFDEAGIDNLAEQYMRGNIDEKAYTEGAQKIRDDYWAAESQNIQLLSNNSHLAHNGFSHLAAGHKDTNGSPLVVDDAPRVAAIAKGLGVGNQSKEAAAFIETGFGQNDGAFGQSFNLTSKGLTASYDKDGYRHRLSVYNHAQFSSLSTQAREGFTSFRTEDGHRYYYKASKAKIDQAQSSN